MILDAGDALPLKQRPATLLIQRVWLGIRPRINKHLWSIYIGCALPSLPGVGGGPWKVIYPLLWGVGGNGAR